MRASCPTNPTCLTPKTGPIRVRRPRSRHRREVAASLRVSPREFCHSSTRCSAIRPRSGGIVSQARFEQSSSGRFRELDVLRGLAALGVVFFHYTFHGTRYYAHYPFFFWPGEF